MDFREFRPRLLVIQCGGNYPIQVIYSHSSRQNICEVLSRGCFTNAPPWGPRTTLKPPLGKYQENYDFEDLGTKPSCALLL